MKKKNTLLIITVLLLSSTGCLQNESDEQLDFYLKNARQLKYSNTIIKEGMSNTVVESIKILNRKPDYRPLGTAMKEVQKLVINFTTYVDSIDTELYQLAGGITTSSEPKDFNTLEKKQLQNRRIASELFMHGNKSNQAVGEHIQQKIVVFQNDCMKILTNISENRTFGGYKQEAQVATEQFQSRFRTMDNTGENWKIVFHKQSVAAHHNTLMSLKNEVLQSGISMIHYFAGQVGILDFFWRNDVLASPVKRDILKGETYEADIFLSGHLEGLITKAQINGEEVQIKKGAASYKITPSRPGEHSYTTEISIQNPISGKTETYTKTFKYEVLKSCD